MVEIKDLFKDSGFIKNTYYYDEIDSTNDRAKKEAGAKVECPALFIAKKQTKGRGRADRIWEMGEGLDLAFSLLLSPEMEISEVQLVTQLAALAVNNALKKLYHKEFKIKWPNDILYEGRKLCGILTEAKLEKSNVKYLIIGIGVNCNSVNFSGELKKTAVSLKNILGTDVDIAQILKKIIEEFSDIYKKFCNKGFNENIIKEIRESSCVIGKYVNLANGDRLRKVLVLDISDKGELIVSNEKNIEERVVSWEILIENNF